jgi:hypothetical protein
VSKDIVPVRSGILLEKISKEQGKTVRILKYDYYKRLRKFGKQCQENVPEKKGKQTL